MATEIKVRRLDDKSLYSAFAAARDAGKAALDEAESLSGSGHKISLTFNAGVPWKVSEDELQEAPGGQFTIIKARLIFSLNVVERGNQSKQEYVSFELNRASGEQLVDAFKMDQSNPVSAMTQPDEEAITKAMYRKLSPLLQPVAPEDGGLVPTLSNLSEAFSATYQVISSELSKAVSAVSDERAKQLTEFEEERRRLREEIAQERKDAANRSDEELAIARRAIDADRAEIEAARAQLEISSHKDARRKQFTEMQNNLRETLGQPVVDTGLNRTRWAVFWAIIAAGVVAALLAYTTITNQPADIASTAAWLLPAVKTTLLTLTSIGAFFSAAAWLRYFYMRDMQSQEEMRRFRNDMARASWVMDAALEIRKEHDEAIPPEWIAGVTEGLFAARKKDTLEEGAQALAALMGMSASATIGPNGPTFELNKRANKQIAAAAKDAE
ncbi:MAG: hypothetical protein GYB50_20355 [Rhodobacteraceae bacterium]|nr:hypothetical protein [Paracoccaceae bacterium]